MKLAVHMSMFCKTWTDDITPYFGRLKEMGFDGVEISLFGARFEDLKNTFRAAAAEGLEIICGTGIAPETDVSSKDPAVRKAGIEYLCSAVDLAAEGGAMFINGVLYAPWQSFGHGEPLEERWKRSADSLQKVGRHAAAKGLGLNCEVLNRFEGDMLNTLEEGSRFVSQIGLPGIRVLADTFHMNIEENDICEAIKENIDSIGCIHICENNRGIPGTGHLPWEKFISALRQVNYQGYLDLECFVEAGTQVGDALGIRRGTGTAPLEEAEKGAAYIRELLQKTEEK